MTNQNTNVPKNIVGKYHLEISQSVQDKENSIPLIRGKQAYARAYIDHSLFKGQNKRVCQAHLHVDGFDIPFGSLNSLTLDPKNPVSRERQRLNWDMAFNFDLDSVWDQKFEKLVTGLLRLESDKNGDSIFLEADEESKEFTVEDSPCLKVTCLLLRYWNDETEEYVMPDPVQVDAIKDFVVSAFPVAENSVVWNTITVQATKGFQSLNKLAMTGSDAEEAASLAIRELLLQSTLHRNMDTYNNPRIDWLSAYDNRTIYLAVFDDPSDQLGGAATDSPTFPVHNVAGAAVVDLNGRIGAHELAHMLGREHPGVPWRKKYGPYLGQRLEDGELKDIYKKGGKYQGFLNVKYETTQGLHISRQFKTPKIYEPNLHFDLMTYRDPQWLSDYSYLGIKERLKNLYKEGLETRYKANVETRVVIGEYDLDRQTGRILFVLPTSYNGLDLQLRESELKGKQNGGAPSDHLENYKNITDQLKIDLIATFKANSDDKVDASCKKVEKDGTSYWQCIYKVYHRLRDNDENKQRDMPNFGIFQATIKADRLQKIELQVAGNVVDVFKDEPTEKKYVYLTLLKDLVQSLTNSIREQKRGATRIEHPARFMRINGHQSLLFFYDVIEDEYYLRFNWLALSNSKYGDELKRDELLDSKMISTIQCKRPGKNEWVTVAISTRRKGNVWISPDLVNRKEISTDPEFRDMPFYSHLSKIPRSLASISSDSIEFRILFSAGFDRAILSPVESKAKIYFPTEFLRNRDDRRVYRTYLGSINRSKKKPRNRSGKHRPMY